MSDNETIELRNTVTRTCLESIQGELPPWTEAYPDGEFITDREFRDTTNWTISKPGALTSNKQYGERQ